MLNLECSKSKFFNHKFATNCKIYIKRYKYKICKTYKQYDFIDNWKI